MLGFEYELPDLKKRDIIRAGEVRKGNGMSETNKHSKDRLFRFIFGREENREWTLSLYNAVNGSSYTDPEAIRVTTIENALYMSMKNDLSFLIADTMNFYEHQSTVNPNMPIRMLIYAGMVYSRYVDEAENQINLYSSRQQTLPVPKLVCFYNGLQEQPDRTVLELKSAFPEGAEADISVRVTMLNINYGRNGELLDTCEPLKEYAQFVGDYRQGRADGLDEEAAITRAIERLPAESKFRKYLTSHRAEVKRMCITEYDEARTMELFKEEGREEGRKEGRKEGRAEGREETNVSNIRKMMKRLKLSAEAAMDVLEIPNEEQHKYALLLKEAEAAGQYSAEG